MASFITRRACTSLCHIRVVANRPLSTATRALPVSTRSIHTSPIAYKKKSKAIADEEQADDLFSDDLFKEEDLIKSSSDSTSASVSTETATESQPPAPTKNKKTKLTQAERQKRFQDHVAYLDLRLPGPKTQPDPTIENPRIRRRSLITLVQMANTEEDLKKVLELLPRFKAADVDPTSEFAEIFARRCAELECPLVSLHLFGNFAKYNTHLTLPAGRELVRSLAQNHPSQLAVALGLFSVYKLPPISADLVTASLVASAYTAEKVKVPGMKEIADRLKEPIHDMLKAQKKKLESPKNSQLERRMKNWVRIALQRANKAQVRNGSEVYVDPLLIPTGKIGPTITTRSATA